MHYMSFECYFLAVPHLKKINIPTKVRAVDNLYATASIKFELYRE